MSAFDLLGNTTVKTVALEQRDELTVLHISNAHADALIALQGAQVLEFTPKGQRPLIWLSEEAQYKRSQAVRGGIPVCWPWFGELKRNPEPIQQLTRGQNLPSHGIVREQTWLLDSIDERVSATTLVLRYATAPAAQPEWPHAATITLAISVGAQLSLQLSTRNDSAAPISFSQALHTYFAISDIAQVEVNGLDRARYIDTLDDWREHPQRGPIRFSAETDRIYLDVPARLELIDRGWQRNIVLRTRNSHSAVLWNPWIEKSQRLSQFAADAYQRMLCIETANVMNDAIMLAPGEGYTLALEIAGANPNPGSCGDE